jgi:phage recombination protein Bet
MNEQLAIKPATSALALMASRYTVEPAKLLATLKATVFKGASDDELLALVVVANSYGLDPLTKQIYAFPAKGGGIVPVVSVDGWISMMNNHPQFDGIEFEDEFENGKITSVTATIHRKDRNRPTCVTEYYAECHRNTDPWNKCPARMLRHKALMQCSRVAFGFSGVHDEDDAVLMTMPVVREIPRAQLPDIPAEPSAVAEPPKRKWRRNAEIAADYASEQATAKPEPAEPAQPANDGPTNRDKLKLLVEESGFTEAQAMHTLRRLRFALPSATGYADVQDTVIADVIADPKTLIDGIASTFD